MTDLQIEVLRCYAAYEKDRTAASATDIAVISGLDLDDVRRARDFLTGARLLTKANSARRRIPRDPEIRARIASMIG